MHSAYFFTNLVIFTFLFYNLTKYTVKLYEHLLLRWLQGIRAHWTLFWFYFSVAFLIVQWIVELRWWYAHIHVVRYAIPTTPKTFNCWCNALFNSLQLPIQQVIYLFYVDLIVLWWSLKRPRIFSSLPSRRGISK